MELLTDGDKRYLVGHDTLGWEDAGGWTYAVPDALGSMRQAVDGAGDLVESREWSPYGVEVGEAQEGLGYTGEWWDAAVGLQYLRARWYDVRTGAFLTRDAVEENHPYLYANGNPVRYTDPSGHDVGCPGGDLSQCPVVLPKVSQCAVLSCLCARPAPQRGDILLENTGSVILGEWDHAMLIVEVNPVAPNDIWTVEATREKDVSHHLQSLEARHDDWVILRVNRSLSIRDAASAWAENLAGWMSDVSDQERRETYGAPFVSMIPFRDSPWGWLDLGPGEAGYYCFEVVVEAYRAQGVELVDMRRAYQELLTHGPRHNTGDALKGLALANLGPVLGGHIYGSSETFVVHRKAWHKW